MIKKGAGYGNHIYSLITGFTVAIYTNNAFIVNSTDIHDYIDEPLLHMFLTRKKNEQKLLFFEFTEFRSKCSDYNQDQKEANFCLLRRNKTSPPTFLLHGDINTPLL